MSHTKAISPIQPIDYLPQLDMHGAQFALHLLVHVAREVHAAGRATQAT